MIFSVAVHAFLVTLHHAGEDVAVLGFREAFHGGEARERFEPEFAAEAGEMAAVILERFQAVPHIPVMHVAPVKAVGIVEAPAGGGGGGPVGADTQSSTSSIFRRIKP
jgi:hypothetical protein